jgi:hypothetical protein
MCIRQLHVNSATNIVQQNTHINAEKEASDSDIVVEDEAAKSLKDRDELCHSAFLGYAKDDLLAINPIWREWNKRPLVSAKVKQTMESFKKHKIQRYLPKNRIPLLVRREWLNVKALQQTLGNGGDELPFIDWVGETHVGAIYGASGQHRFEALKDCKEKIKNDLEKAVKDMKKAHKEVEELRTANLLENEGGEELIGLRVQVRRLQGELKIAGYWGFALYDYGMNDFFSKLLHIYNEFSELATAKHGQIAKILSENECLHNYNETPNEFFTNMIRDIVDDVKDNMHLTKVHEKYHHLASQKGHVHSDVIGNLSMLTMYIETAPIHRYFITTRLFQPHWITKNLLGQCGGVCFISYHYFMH